jgi:D-alanyl-D-alanine carboxypeptidase/Ig-like domain from next to BRCA1 gene
LARLVDTLHARARATAHPRLQSLGIALISASLAGLGLTGCAEPELATGQLEARSTVGDYTGSGCSTAVVLGLSEQVGDEVGCMLGGELAKFDPTANLEISGGAVLLYLAPDARDDLQAAAQSGTIQLTSAYRTVAQQYLLYRWYQQGRCGITAAATPGRSNHESGRAVDVGNYSSRVSVMAAHGWAHDVPGDPVHFDHTASADLRGSDVLGFQRLWNRNHPDDPIDEDGLYGPQTGARLDLAPAGGFAIGATCGADTRTLTARIAGDPGPLAPGTRATFTVELTNTGTATWPAATRLVTAPADRASAIYDPMTWTSASEVAALGADVGPGQTVAFDLPVVAPMSDVVTHVDEAFELADGDDRFGMIAVTVQIVPDGMSPSDDSAPDDTQGDAPGDDGDGPIVVGGCAAGGGGAGWLVGLAPLALVGRRRRR